MPRLDALADPFRLGVVRYLDRHPDASAPDVAAGLGLHLNTARAHLGALVDARVAARTSASGGLAGRLSVLYRLEEGSLPDFDELICFSGLLATAILRH